MAANIQAHIEDLPPSSSASFHYIKDQHRFRSEKPYFFNGSLELHQEDKRTNIIFEEHSGVPLHDLRGHFDSLSLDQHGIQVVYHESKFAQNLQDDNALKAFYGESMDLLREFVGNSEIIFYDSRFRRTESPKLFNDLTTEGSAGAPEDPVWLAHVDHTIDGGARRVKYHLTEEETAKYFDGSWRIRIINMWRPLYRPVEEAPLAFCDASTLSTDDILPVDTPGPYRVGEVYHVKYNPAQRWYYISNQTPSEVSLFMSWDTDPGENPSYIAHAAAGAIPGSIGKMPRESVELRALVFTKKEN